MIKNQLNIASRVSKYRIKKWRLTIRVDTSDEPLSDHFSNSREQTPKRVCCKFCEKAMLSSSNVIGTMLAEIAQILPTKCTRYTSTRKVEQICNMCFVQRKLLAEIQRSPICFEAVFDKFCLAFVIIMPSLRPTARLQNLRIIVRNEASLKQRQFSTISARICADPLILDNSLTGSLFPRALLTGDKVPLCGHIGPSVDLARRTVASFYSQ